MSDSLGLTGLVALYKSRRGLSRRRLFLQGVRSLARKLVGSVAKRKHILREKIILAHFKALGPKFGTMMLWNVYARTLRSYEVERCIFWFKKHHPDQIGYFVCKALDKVVDPSVLLTLAVSEVSAPDVASKIRLINDQPPPEFKKRCERNQVFAAAFVGAQMLLHGKEAAERADHYAQEIHGSYAEEYNCFYDSISFSPQNHEPLMRFESGYQTPKSHRLLIINNAKDFRKYTHLLRDAARVTIIDLADIYGKITLDDRELAKKTTVEHIRTRITRFSSEYIRLHEETKRTVEQLMHHLTTQDNAGQVLFGSAARHIALDLADSVFFDVLRVRALKKLISDPAFDHIVVAYEGVDELAFQSYLSCIPELQSDDRVEFVSVAQTTRLRLQAKSSIVSMRFANRTCFASSDSPPLNSAKRELVNAVSRRVRRMGVQRSVRPNHLLVVTDANPAYKSSTTASLATLANSYQISAVFVRNSLGAFLRNNPRVKSVIKDVSPISVSHKWLTELPDLSKWLHAQFIEALQILSDTDLAAIARAFGRKYVEEVLLPDVTDFFFATIWLEQLQKNGRLPSLIIISPHRQPKLGVFCEAARSFNIPSLALEPHGLNGRYCRYSKVSMDYYGVISKYFTYSAARDFGIDHDRCRVVGSPRIVVPENYNALKAQLAARKTLTCSQQLIFKGGRAYLAFFGQPSQWHHVAKVWENILTATEGLGITILLKAHPEESETRKSQYMEIATNFGAKRRVYVVDGDPNLIINASDLLLTGYSAAALDGAVLGKPVICVTAGDASYPVEQHKIVHSSLCRSAAELRQELLCLLNNPDEQKRRYRAFLAAEPQFLTGPEELLKGYVADILQKQQFKALRSEEERPHSLFLAGPFETFQI